MELNKRTRLPIIEPQLWTAATDLLHYTQVDDLEELVDCSTLDLLDLRHHNAQPGASWFGLGDPAGSFRCRLPALIVARRLTTVSSVPDTAQQMAGEVRQVTQRSSLQKRCTSKWRVAASI